MRDRVARVATMAAATLLIGVTALAQEPVGPKLPGELRALLLREMNAIQNASLEIQGALIRGEDARVAELAQGIHDSFILRQEMTEADRKALQAAVPRAFVERDRAFHELTGELAAAARAGEDARQRALFGEMVAACAACHARYATNRFPGFASD